MLECNTAEEPELQHPRFTGQVCGSPGPSAIERACSQPLSNSGWCLGPWLSQAPFVPTLNGLVLDKGMDVFDVGFNMIFHEVI